MSTSAILLIAIGIPVFILVFLVSFMALLFYIFSRVSGWSTLAQRYGAKFEPDGTLYQRQTIKVGSVRWRFAAMVGVSPSGLYLAVTPRFGPLRRLIPQPPLLIPWSDIKVVGPGHIYLGWQAVELSVGNPRITSLTVPQRLYQILAPYLTRSA